jgi:predicted component of type VI protein secretion system
MLIEEVYDALKEAGASEEKSRAAARAIATYEDRLADVRPTLRLHNWMLATIIALNIAILFRVFSS